MTCRTPNKSKYLNRALNGPRNYTVKNRTLSAFRSQIINQNNLRFLPEHCSTHSLLFQKSEQELVSPALIAAKFLTPQAGQSSLAASANTS